MRSSNLQSSLSKSQQLGQSKTMTLQAVAFSNSVGPGDYNIRSSFQSISNQTRPQSLSFKTNTKLKNTSPGPGDYISFNQLSTFNQKGFKFNQNKVPLEKMSQFRTNENIGPQTYNKPQRKVISHQFSQAVHLNSTEQAAHNAIKPGPGEYKPENSYKLLNSQKGATMHGQRPTSINSNPGPNHYIQSYHGIQRTKKGIKFSKSTYEQKLQDFPGVGTYTLRSEKQTKNFTFHERTFGNTF